MTFFINVVVPLVIVLATTSTVSAQSSPHGPLSIACTDCHTTESWKELATPMKFSHSTTSFTLEGAHANISCLSCHTNKKFAGTANDCSTCHQKDFSKTLTPNHLLGKFSHDCTTCHTMSTWRPSNFQHSKTNFQLTGAHTSVDCASCHTNNRYAGLPSDCFNCHQQDFLKTTAPNHQLSLFSHDCLTCHSNMAWKPATFDHNKTNFALIGAHQAVECSRCHKSGRYQGLSTDCFGCHQQDYVQTANPNHQAAQFDHNCQSCHSMMSWRPSTFDHSKTTFPLVGIHATIECNQCHKNGQFKGLTVDCYGCHSNDYTRSTNPNHQLTQFGHDCASCHSSISWKPSTFDHSRTIFALVGAHKRIDCNDCHSKGQFKNVPTDCYQCHQSQFAKTIDPSHTAGLFSHDCTTCHTMDGWKPSTFDHNKTNFQLLGAHRAVNCNACHQSGQFRGLPSDCFSCHSQEYAKTTTPNHSLAQFSHDCVTCHSVFAWKPSTFDHSKTNFPLTGIHLTTDCLFCHKNGVFRGTPTDCYSCHQADFIRVTDPNHVTANFDHNCSICHSTTAWNPATFDHTKTSFPLTGAHVQILCATCHVGGKYAGTPTDCYSCHQKDYNATINPNHVIGQYPKTCASCHSTAAWRPSTFNHDPLFKISSGKHSNIVCTDCHTTPTSYTLYSCYKCHSQSSMDREHRDVAGYSAQCINCHKG